MEYLSKKRYPLRVKFAKTLFLIRGMFVFALLAGATASGSAVEQELGQFIASPATLALTIYQRFISPAKGSACPMEPSDSAYARQAIHRYGLFQGALMSADRLHRCGHDVNHYDIVRTARGLKFFDPVDPEEPRP